MPPLDKGEAAELAGCQQALHKAQAAFAKVKVKSLHKCLQGVLSPTVAFENAVMTQAKYDAAIDAARARCTKGYDKIAAASTRMVDAILAACAPVEQLLVGVYDGLRMQALAEGSVDSLVEIAGFVCTGTEAALDAQIVLATPRMVELLDILGPGFLQASSVLGEGGYPAVPLDPRCPPIESLGGMLPSP
ncbi:MAG TPA: hypothetical protein VEL28_19360 [Candidatus Binatia bacterium]|nr:hypothetical protein [Candidatus Binatia bacterium]